MLALIKRRETLVGALIGLAIGGIVGCVGINSATGSARQAADSLQTYIDALESENPAVGRITGNDRRLFTRIFARVKSDYVNEVTDDELLAAAKDGLQEAVSRTDLTASGKGSLVYAASHAMLRNLDPYSDFLERDAFKSLREETRGEFGGLGIEISKRDGELRVVSPIDNTPAQRAGILSNDIITHADGVEIEPLSLREAVNLLRGKPGSDVELTIRRDGVDGLLITVTREIIQVTSVRSRMEGDIGYVRISSFSAKTEESVLDALSKLRAEAGGKMKAVILDLRSNPGGLLDQSIGVSDVFLNEGLVVFTKSRSGGQEFFSRNGDALDGAPLLVLINGGSASASEIVAGALQDRNRATLLGEKSFGKGSVQTIFPLDAGRGMKLTTALYFTPTGRSVEGGISPDVEIADNPDTEEDEQLQEALRMAADLAGGPSIFWNSGSTRQ